MKKRTIGQINEKIENNNANIYTAEEFKKLIKEDETPSFDEVDVVTTGTCGVMSGTAAIFNFVVSEPGVFMRAKNIYLNGVPANIGPCPNEWLGSVDLILHGTSKSIENPVYGGGFLLKDILEGKDIAVKVETINGDIVESTTNINEIGRAQMIGTRMAFKNYNSFVNPDNHPVSSIFSAIPLEGNLSGFTFSGCGDLNPLQNDPNHNIIKNGTKVLLNGAESIVLGDGTRSSVEKPNLMITGNLKEMDPTFLGGFKTGEGGEVYDTVAIPIPVLNEEIYNNLLIKNSDIPLSVCDIKGRHLPLSETTYGDVWEGHELRPKYDRESCSTCDKCIVEEICPTNAFSDKRLDLYRCFGCGMCVHYCKNNSFNMNIGNVDLAIEGKIHTVPIICRQSDALRANKLSLKLKKMIENQEFRL
ncbi:methanogenesis marker 16 metalloprotein [uncultured Methanobrevibacter sp.]|uniref:methanogenesis marker 16 metalloprotein n=1 Tax=uncultured Methanobrevibacter sp. TaxID=253161 RepID=UPI00260FE265|nr:methanogenesis marker 16 metalloprotein [uncultured Methanobrevibacter sp.]